VGNKEEVAASLAGQFVIPLTKAAERATEALLRTLRCESDSSESRNPSNGFKEVWDRVEAAAVEALDALVAKSRAALVESTSADSKADAAGNAFISPR
jgi:DNA-binding IscR family transcriptional regulator